MKKSKKIVSLLITLLMLLSAVPVMNLGTKARAADHYYYSQYGWGIGNSGCYITSYAMVLSNTGKVVTPYDVYVANGYTVYCYHSKIASYYGFSTSTFSLSGSTAQKQAVINSYLDSNPQGVIVGGCYDSAHDYWHYVVARRDDSGSIRYFIAAV